MAAPRHRHRSPIGVQCRSQAAALHGHVHPPGFLPSGVIYLLPQPQDTLCRLIAHLTESFPDTPPYGGTVAEPIPHLTVAKTTPGPGRHELADQIHEILRPELPIDIDIDRVTVMKERPDETWHSVAHLPFGHERNPPPHS